MSFVLPKQYMTYDEFTEFALYDASSGYYRNNNLRVGRQEQADFYTSESFPLFFELLMESAKSLLNTDINDSTFVHIGAEPSNTKPNIERYLPISLGNPIEFPENSIVFANELLDAQPFHRLVYQSGKWHELGVKYDDKALTEVLLPHPSEAIKDLLPTLPTPEAEPTHLDISLKTESLFRQIVSKPAQLYLFIDYGHELDTLLREFPQGTARAYFKHKQHNDLLKNPGQQDLTSHVIWDRLTPILQENGYQFGLMSQESFFIHHAQSQIEAIISQGSAQLSQLKELIHPSHFGQKFQILYALRT